MRHFAALASLCLAFLGCGTHRITYVHGSATVDNHFTYVQHSTHAHGIGPLLVGGGGYFGILNEMSPALIDYTGPLNLAATCPYGFSEVSHHHAFWQSFVAGAISWVVIINAYHMSDVEVTCLQPSPAPPAPPATSQPTAPLPPPASDTPTTPVTPPPNP